MSKKKKKVKIAVPYVMVDVYEIEVDDIDDACNFEHDPEKPEFVEGLSLEDFHKKYGESADWDRYDFDTKVIS